MRRKRERERRKTREEEEDRDGRGGVELTVEVCFKSEKGRTISTGKKRRQTAEPSLPERHAFRGWTDELKLPERPKFIR